LLKKTKKEKDRERERERERERGWERGGEGERNERDAAEKPERNSRLRL